MSAQVEERICFVWRAIPGAEYFEVSKAGEIRSSATKRPIKPYKHRNGHLYVLRRVGGVRGKQTKTYVHRAVLLAFVGPSPEGHECRHGNGNPEDNRLENLSWSTHRENSLDRAAHGTLPVGKRNGRSKLNDEAVLEIRARAKTEQLEVLAREYGVHGSVISRVVAGKSWAHVRAVNP